MNESADPGNENETKAVVETVRTEEPLPAAGAEEPDHDTVSDETVMEKAPGDDVDPGTGGYGQRDPKTEMPAVPSVKETQHESKPHEAAPDPKTSRPSGNV